VKVESAELMSRARDGDGDAFRQLTEPYRRELQVHFYRMLGSFQDAEDAFQDTLRAAWQHFSSFEGRASLRTWLYRIATNKCLDARRSASRRPAKEWDVPNVEPPEPSRLGEVVWLEPYPDALLDGGSDALLGPEARYERNESISLAFVTALQVLPPRQVAVLVLCDVLGFHADEVARNARLDGGVSQQRAQTGTGQPRTPLDTCPRLCTAMTASGGISGTSSAKRASRSLWTNTSSSSRWSGVVRLRLLGRAGSHMLQRAWVGDIRAARRAGHSPAMVPMRMAAPMPPAQARVGMTMSSCLVVA